MAFTFPSNPVNGQIYEAANGFTYVYRAASDSWLATQPLTTPGSSISGPIGYTGSLGPIGYTGSSGNMLGLPATIPTYPPGFVGPIPPPTSIEFLNFSPRSRILLSIYNLRISDSSGILIQFGTSTGYITGPTSYMSSSSSINGQTGAIDTKKGNNGFLINLNSNSVFLNTNVTIANVSENLWTCTHHGAANSPGTLATIDLSNHFTVFGGGSINLASNLINKLRITCVSLSATIQTGSARILYDDAGI